MAGLRRMVGDSLHRLAAVTTRFFMEYFEIEEQVCYTTTSPCWSAQQLKHVIHMSFANIPHDHTQSRKL